MDRALYMERKALVRFLRYVLVGGTTFLFDLLLLYAVTAFLGVPYYLATPGAFLIAVSLNYLISRGFVFRGTTRRHTIGYSVFIGVAVIGALVTTLGVTLFVTYAGIHFLVARVLTSLVVGMGNYLFNLFFNFKVVGLHH
jgi:putative flippase GtrA